MKTFKLGIVLLAISTLAACSPGGKNSQKPGGPPGGSVPELPPVVVRFEPVTYKVVSDSYETIGELKADREALISAESPGQIQKILVKEGDWIQAGDSLVQLKADDIQADIDFARSDFEKYKVLYEEGAVSKQQFEQAENQVKRLEAQLTNLDIKAIFSGTVGAIYVDPGDFVRQGDSIMDLVKNYPLRVTFNMPEKYVSYTKVGHEIMLKTDNGSQKPLYAKVDFIAPRVDPNTRTVLIRAKLNDGSKQSLRANQFVDLVYPLNGLKKTLMVREEAIYLDQGQQFIYKAVEEEQEQTEESEEEEKKYRAERVAVLTGIRQDSMVEIVNGIKEKDLIIYAGLQKVFPGAKLSPLFE